MQIAVLVNPDDPYRPYEVRNVPYDVSYMVWKFSVCGGPKGSLSHQLNVHGVISELMGEIFPNEPLKPDSTLHDKFCFMLDTCPSYIGGSEVEQSGILDEIMGSVPKELSKTAAKKWAREQFKQRFHIQGRKHPYWIQEPEWPMYQGEPMEYVRTERTSVEYQTHVFRNPKTGTERKVFDAH